MKAVIPAAGLGTRFLPMTKNSPKEMLPLLDKPAIQYVVEEAVASGCDDILIITGRGKRAVEDHFDRTIELEHFLRDNGKNDALSSIQDISELADIHYIRQKEAKGLGHAVLCAKKHVGDEPFAVLLGDDIVFSETPCTKQLIDQYEATQASVIAVEPITPQQTRAYGVVGAGGDPNARLRPIHELVEKPAPEDAPSDLGILGRYVLSPGIFEALEQTPRGKNGELQLTDALHRLLATEPVHSYAFEGRRFDLGNKMEWLKTNIEVALMREDYADELRGFLEALLQKPLVPEARA